MMTKFDAVYLSNGIDSHTLTDSLLSNNCVRNLITAVPVFRAGTASRISGD